MVHVILPLGISHAIPRTFLTQAAAKLKAEQEAQPGSGSGSWETITEDASWETDTQGSPPSATSPPSEGSPLNHNAPGKVIYSVQNILLKRCDSKVGNGSALPEGCTISVVRQPRWISAVSDSARSLLSL
jgi:hypothetical protein